MKRKNRRRQPEAIHPPCEHHELLQLLLRTYVVHRLPTLQSIDGIDTSKLRSKWLRLNHVLYYTT